MKRPKRVFLVKLHLCEPNPDVVSHYILAEDDVTARRRAEEIEKEEEGGWGDMWPGVDFCEISLFCTLSSKAQ